MGFEELQRKKAEEAEEFLSMITRENLEEAKDLLEELRDEYWDYTHEADLVYRAYRGSFKVYGVRDFIVRYLRVVLKLLGEDTIEPRSAASSDEPRPIIYSRDEVIDKLNELDFNALFIDLIDDALSVESQRKFNRARELNRTKEKTPYTEWQPLFSALQHAKTVAESSVRFVEKDIFGGDFPPWDRTIKFYEALVYSIFNKLSGIRIGLDQTMVVDVVMNSSEDVSEACEWYVEKVSKEHMMTLEEYAEKRGFELDRQNGKR